MSHRDLKALSRALTRAQLDHLAALPDCVVGMRPVAGVLHSRFGCGHLRNAGAASVPVPLSRLLSPDTVVCPECEAEIARGCGAGSDAMKLFGLLEAVQLARSAERFAADPGKSRVVGKATTLCNQLVQAASAVANRSTAGEAAEWSAARTRVLAQLEAAGAALADARRDPALREKVAARITDELLPRPLRKHVVLEQAEVLVGITPHHSTNKRVQEVLDAFTVGGTDRHVVLLCPRYVVDYLNRNYAAGYAWTAAILTVPADGLTSTQVKVAATAWNPDSGGPLADLGRAVQAARDSLTTAEVA